MECTAFFVSDSTGITAETVGASLLLQFEAVEFQRVTIPYVTSVAQAERAVAKINETPGHKLVFSTLLDDETRAVFSKCDSLVLDIFAQFLQPMSQALKLKPDKNIGRLHAVKSREHYDMRIAAVQYTLNADDGGNTHHYDLADVIILGVSRCGKTPTCLYLALKYGISAANYPLTERDLDSHTLPETVRPYEDKLVGLTIDPVRLHEIRQQRYNNSRYATLSQCEHELKQASRIFQRAGLVTINTTGCSVEEIATKIVHRANIQSE